MWLLQKHSSMCAWACVSVLFYIYFSLDHVEIGKGVDDARDWALQFQRAHQGSQVWVHKGAVRVQPAQYAIHKRREVQ